MEAFYIKTEARLFCILILVFLYAFKEKNFKSTEKNGYLCASLLACILLSILADVVKVDILQTLCFALYGLSCFVAACLCCEQIFSSTELKSTQFVKTVSVFVCTVIGVLAFFLLTNGINAITYLLTLSVMILFVVEQNNKIRVDNLTKLYNRYGMDVELKEQLRQYRLEHEDSFYVIACDLDNFKHINDTWGHPEGDRALSLVAGVLAKVGRKFDSAVFRIGGDEFVIITDKSPKGLDVEVTNAIKTELDNLDFRDDFDIKMSIGTALYDGVTTIDELLNNADKKLYEAKKTK